MNMLLVKDMQGAAVTALKRRLLRELGDAAGDYTGLATGAQLDADTEAAVRRWQSGVGLVADGIVGPRCQEILELTSLPALEIEVDVAAVRQLFPATKPANLVRYLPYVLAALRAAGLTDRAMICAALGSVRAESEGFVPIWSETKGNAQRGCAPPKPASTPAMAVSTTTSNCSARPWSASPVQRSRRRWTICAASERPWPRIPEYQNTKRCLTATTMGSILGFCAAPPLRADPTDGRRIRRKSAEQG